MGIVVKGPVVNRIRYFKRVYELNKFHLKNMVTAEEVDDELEEETKEECSKYGEVNKCVIHVVRLN